MWFYCRNRTGGVVFYAMPRCVPALQQLCRVTIRKQVISTKVDHLHLPVRLKEFLKYHDLWFTWDFPKTLISLTLYLMIHVYKPNMEFFLNAFRAWICMKSLLLWEGNSVYLPFVTVCSWMASLSLVMWWFFYLHMYLSFEKFRC